MNPQNKQVPYVVQPAGVYTATTITGQVIAFGHLQSNAIISNKLRWLDIYYLRMNVGQCDTVLHLMTNKRWHQHTLKWFPCYVISLFHPHRLPARFFIFLCFYIKTIDLHDQTINVYTCHVCVCYSELIWMAVGGWGGGTEHP